MVFILHLATALPPMQIDLFINNGILILSDWTSWSRLPSYGQGNIYLLKQDDQRWWWWMMSKIMHIYNTLQISAIHDSFHSYKLKACMIMQNLKIAIVLKIRIRALLGRIWTMPVDYCNIYSNANLRMNWLFKKLHHRFCMNVHTII